MNKERLIKKDIKNLEKVAEAIESKNYAKAYKYCRLSADIYYKPVGVIQNQLHHNITYDAENVTDFAKQYALHLIVDAKFVLNHLLGAK